MRGRPQPYPGFVDCSRIKICSQGNCRYSLRVPLTTNPTKPLLVILKNPSAANQFESDHTINRVLYYVKATKMCCDEVMFTNLFAYYHPSPRGLVGKDIETIVGERNDAVISKLAQQASRIIVAWGGPSVSNSSWVRTYNERVVDVLTLLQGRRLQYVGRVSSKGPYPLHGQVWGYDMELHDFDRPNLPISN